MFQEIIIIYCVCVCVCGPARHFQQESYFIPIKIICFHMIWGIMALSFDQKKCKSCSTHSCSLHLINDLFLLLCCGYEQCLGKPALNAWSMPACSECSATAVWYTHTSKPICWGGKKTMTTPWLLSLRLFLSLSNQSMFACDVPVGRGGGSWTRAITDRFLLRSGWRQEWSLHASTPNCCLNLSALRIASLNQPLNSRAQSS